MSRYLRKQIIILIVFLLILSALGTGIYFLFRTKPVATCSDGIRNQGEEGVDCGKVCGNYCKNTRAPLEIISQDFIPTSENNYDLIAEVKNPNNVWGAQAVNYTFYLYDANGENIASQQGVAYILPQEKKYIIEPKVYSLEKPQSVQFKIGNVSWQRLTDFSDMTLKIKEKNIEIGEGVTNRIYGVVQNSTSYNLSKVEFVGVIFDDNGKIVAAGKTELSTLMIGETRYFEISWPYVVNAINPTFDIRAYVNIFDKDTFINVQGAPSAY